MRDNELLRRDGGILTRPSPPAVPQESKQFKKKEKLPHPTTVNATKWWDVIDGYKDTFWVGEFLARVVDFNVRDTSGGDGLWVASQSLLLYNSEGQEGESVEVNGAHIWTIDRLCFGLQII